MFVIPVRMNVTHWVVTFLMAIVMLNPWTPEVVAQDPREAIWVHEVFEDRDTPLALLGIRQIIKRIWRGQYDEVLRRREALRE